MSEIGEDSLSRSCFTNEIDMTVLGLFMQETSLAKKSTTRESQINNSSEWHFVILECEEGLRTGGPKRDLYNNLGVAWLALNELDKAEAALLKAAQYPDARAKQFYNLALVHAAKGRKNQACENYRKAIALDAHYFEALVNLANLSMEMGDEEGALEHFRKAHAQRPQDVSVSYLLAALEDRYVPKAPEQYVRNLFDQYAPTFEQQLLNKLNYQVPEALQKMLARHRADIASKGTSLDLGCGTGIMGQVLSDYCQSWVGVDLSEKMLEQARLKSCYDELHAMDLTCYLKKTQRLFSLFVAADSFIYMGDLQPVFLNMQRCAQRNALVAFSIEHCPHNEQMVKLKKNGRYAHCVEDVVKIASLCGWQLVEHEYLVLRYQNGRPQMGSLVLLKFQGIGRISRFWG